MLNYDGMNCMLSCRNLVRRFFLKKIDNDNDDEYNSEDDRNVFEDLFTM